MSKNESSDEKNNKINIENLLTYPDSKLSHDARLIKNYFVK